MKSIWLALLFSGSQVFATEILLVGDSLTCGPFGQALVREMSKDSGNHVTVYCTVSSSPTHWLNGKNPGSAHCHSCSGSECAGWLGQKNDEDGMAECQDVGAGQTPKLDAILKKKKYDKVVVALGTNRPAKSTSVDATYGDVVKTIREAGVQSCAWVGPPHVDVTKPVFNENRKFTDEASYLKAKYKNFAARDGNVAYKKSLDEFYSSLSSTVEKESGCHLIDSRSYTADPKPEDTVGDGVHRTAAASEPWAREVAALLSGAGPSAKTGGASR